MTVRGVAVFVETDEKGRSLWQVIPPINGHDRAVSMSVALDGILGRTIGPLPPHGWALMPIDIEGKFDVHFHSPRIGGQNPDYIAIVPLDRPLT